jgi:uncharacterized membrane protein YoaK (UPF0700 family)
MLESPTPDRKATVLLLLALAGCVDAMGLAETGRFYVSAMSGNTTSMAQMLALGDYRPALLPLGLIVLFVAGATIGTLIAEKARRFAAPALLLVVGLLVAGAWAGLGTARPALGVMLLPVAMGAINIVTMQGGRAYATGALVRLGVGLAGLGRDARGREVGFDLAVWLCLFAGSLAGAALRLRYGGDVLLGVAALLGLAALGHLVAVLRRR